MAEKFEAAAQYDDWRGQFAADDLSNGDIRDLIRERGLVGEEQFLVGVSFYSSENDFVSVGCYFVEATGVDEARQYLDSEDTPDVSVAYIRDLNAQQFVRLFKRFDIAMSWKGLDLIERELEIRELDV